MTQEENVLQHLREGKTITPLEALNLYGSFRLGAIIFNLRQQGYNIITETEHKNNKHYARYHLEPKEEQRTFGF